MSNQPEVTPLTEQTVLEYVRNIPEATRTAAADDRGWE